MWIHIVPGTRPGPWVQHFDNVPGGTRCVIAEAPNGHTKTIRVIARGSHKVIIHSGVNTTAHLRDTFRVRTFRPPKPHVTG